MNNTMTAQAEPAQAGSVQRLVSPHPWRRQASNLQKLKAARKQRDRRYQRDWHRQERADETYKQAEHERDVARRANSELNKPGLSK